MAKKRTVNKELHYKSIINKQKKIIQKLKKSLGRADKVEARYFDLEERELELLMNEDVIFEKVVDPLACPECGGQIEIIEGGRINVHVCQNCKYRASKKVKK